MNENLNSGKIKKVVMFVVISSMVSLIPVLIYIVKSDDIDIGYDSSIARNKILDKIAPENNTVDSVRMMERNGFSCTSQSDTIFQCERSDGRWPTYEGTDWIVELYSRNNKVFDVKVWIEPSD